MFLLTDSIPHVNQIFFDTAMLKTPSQRSYLQKGGWVYLDAPSTAGPGQKYAIMPTTADDTATGIPDAPSTSMASLQRTKLLYPVFFSRPSDSDFNPIPASGLITLINPIIPVEGWVTSDSYYQNNDSTHPNFAAGKPVRIKMVTVTYEGASVLLPRLVVLDDTTIASAEKVAACQIGWALSPVIDGKVKIRYQFA